MSIYIISPPIFNEGWLNKLEHNLQARLDDVKCFQLRLKPFPANALEIADKVKAVCHQYDIAFIINDDVALAKACNADGVHLGEHDTAINQARAVLGVEKTIGISCYNSKHRAMLMAEQGADYVAFGTVHYSDTKPNAPRVSVEMIADWVKFTNVPCVAIGGITRDNMQPLLDIGVDAVAMINGYWRE